MRFSRDRRIDEMLAGVDYDEAKKVGHCQVWYRKGLIEYYRYHDTDIAVYFQHPGTLRLYHGGWVTVNTKKNMGRALDMWGFPFSVFQDKSKWYVASSQTTVPFFEGVTLTRDGQVKNSERADVVESDLDDWRKKIDAYMRKLSKMLDEQGMIEPTAGDPWIWGEDSIRSQIEEKYVTGSLIIKALEYTGQVDMLRYGIFIKDSVMRSVRKYLKSNVGLAA